MGPPATPLPSSTQQPAKDNQDVSEKYRKLKRRYFELEEVTLPVSFVIPSPTEAHP